MGVLRFLLAASVVLGHSTPFFGYTILTGETAVKAFFVISGFYMTMVWREKYGVLKNGVYKFWKNRMLRIYPVYYFSLGCHILLSFLYYKITECKIGAIWLYEKFFCTMNFFDLSWLIGTSIFIFGQDINSFLVFNQNESELMFAPQFLGNSIPAGNFDFVPQGWTLGCEMLFYLIVPFIITTEIKYIFAGLIISLVARSGTLLFFDRYTSYGNVLFTSNRCIISLFYLFMMGAISYEFFKILKNHECMRSNKAVQLIVFIFILGLTIGVDAKVDWQSIAYTVFIMLSIPFVFELTKNSKLDKSIGEISFPIYMIHYSIAPFITSVSKKINPSLNGALLLIVTIIVSCFIVRWIENPIQTIRSKTLIRH